MKEIKIFYAPEHIYHKYRGSPENPKRIEMIYKYLKNHSPISKLSNVEFVNVMNPARLEDIQKIHDPNYLDFLEKTARDGERFLGDSTYLNRYSLKCAFLAVEASLLGAKCILNGDCDYSYVLTRPPGHHASKDMYGGYCLLNNAAITAANLIDRGLKKIAIIDWDGHAANGTMKIFYDDPNVLLISLHKDPLDFYPREGFMYQTGTKEGRGTTINIEMPTYSGNREYQIAFEEIINPIIEQFKPDFIIGENGFDSHHSAKDVKLMLTSEGYYNIIQNILSYNKPLSILQEGGYTPKVNAEMSNVIVSALLDLPYEKLEEKTDTLSYALIEKTKSATKTHKIFGEKINELKNILSDFYYL